MKINWLRFSIMALLLSCIAPAAMAQFQTAYIGVNGLTCSQCTRTVEMRIRKLPFVTDVQMNLEHTEGKIVLAKDKKIELDKVAQAVEDAGFSVRYLSADFKVSNAAPLSGECFMYQGDEYVFAKPPKGGPGDVVTLRFIGKKFMPRAELKKMQPLLTNKCAETQGTVYFVMPAKSPEL